MGAPSGGICVLSVCTLNSDRGTCPQKSGRRSNQGGNQATGGLASRAVGAGCAGGWTVSKTGVGEISPRVRIPPSPLHSVRQRYVQSNLSGKQGERQSPGAASLCLYSAWQIVHHASWCFAEVLRLGQPGGQPDSIQWPTRAVTPSSSSRSRASGRLLHAGARPGRCRRPSWPTRPRNVW
jgi:hypothetical protein